jgi:hypothetical protein
MLSRNCKISHLNASQWHRLSELAFGAEEARRVYLLHDKGRPLRLWKSGAGDLPLPEGRVEDPQAQADALKSAHPDASEAWVLDPEAFAQGMAGIQSAAAYETQLDVHALFDFEERRKIPGHAVSPQGDLIWRCLPIRRLQRFAQKMLPASCTYVLGVFDGDALWASLLVQFQDGQIVAISTSDALPAEDVKDILGRDQHPFFLSVVANAFRRPAFGWFVEKEPFVRWMRAKDESAKEEAFQMALMQNQATFDFNILIDRGITALAAINPGEAAIAGADRELNPRTRTPDPSETPPSAV